MQITYMYIDLYAFAPQGGCRTHPHASLWEEKAANSQIYASHAPEYTKTPQQKHGQWHSWKVAVKNPTMRQNLLNKIPRCEI